MYATPFQAWSRAMLFRERNNRTGNGRLILLYAQLRPLLQPAQQGLRRHAELRRGAADATVNFVQGVANEPILLSLDGCELAIWWQGVGFNY
jgi:hypothetical protein